MHPRVHQSHDSPRRVWRAHEGLGPLHCWGEHQRVRFGRHPGTAENPDTHVNTRPTMPQPGLCPQERARAPSTTSSTPVRSGHL